MPITTYVSTRNLHKYEAFTNSVLDQDERAILDKLSKRVLLAEYPTHPRRRLFGLLPPKQPQEPMVEVLLHVASIEWQCFNFPPRHGCGWSIITVVKLSEAKAWIWGIGVGLEDRDAAGGEG